jgi:hypothetical protein
MDFEASEMVTVRNYEELRARYAHQYGVQAGYLPSSLDGLLEWLGNTSAR